MLATSFTKKEARTKSNTQEPPSKQEEAGSEQQPARPTREHGDQSQDIPR